jgi:hypothetical protein
VSEGARAQQPRHPPAAVRLPEADPVPGRGTVRRVRIRVLASAPGPSSYPPGGSSLTTVETPMRPRSLATVHPAEVRP